MPNTAGPRVNGANVRWALARTLAAVAVAVYALAGCAGPAGPPPVVVGSGPGATGPLLAQIYAAALRYYGSPARVVAVGDPIAGLDGGTVSVAPALTGAVLTRLEPDAHARAAEQVYRSMVAALPEGIGAGDYAPSAQDKPALAVTTATAAAWGERDVSALTARCRGVRVGSVPADAPPSPPVSVATCALPVGRSFADEARLYAGLRDGTVTAGWTTTAAPGDAADDARAQVVVLSDRTSLIRAQNVVPLYRRGVLDDRQVIALDEVAGELDTGSLADMLGRVAGGVDPAALAAQWLDAHPLGH